MDHTFLRKRSLAGQLDFTIVVGVDNNNNNNNNNNNTTTTTLANAISSNSNSNNEVPIVYLVLPVLLLLGLCFFCGGRGAGEEYHRQGTLIRERAERIWAQQRRKAKRHQATTEERIRAIHDHIQTMVVVSKNDIAHTCVLSSSNRRRRDDATNEPKPQSPPNEDAAANHDSCDIRGTMVLESKPSTDTADTMLLDLDESSDESSESNSNENPKENAIEAMILPDHSIPDKQETNDDDDEYVCHICLDGFEVGDVVVFQRPNKHANSNSNSNNRCTHVFHKECLFPWLLEKRENECPSCRAQLLPDENDDDENDDDEQEQHDENDEENENENDDSWSSIEFLQRLEHSNDCDNNNDNIETDIETGILGCATTTATTANNQEEDNTIYCIVKGRIVIEPHEKQKQQQCREVQVPPPVLAASCIHDESTTTRPFQLSTPIPLRRISQSLDSSLYQRQRRQRQRQQQRSSNDTDFASLLGLNGHAVVANNSRSNMHGEDDDDEDEDVIVGMTFRPHQNVSSIFANKQR